MIESLQFVVMMAAAMIIVGVTAPVLAEAQESINTTRDNIKRQSIAHEQEACTNIASGAIPGGSVLSQVQSNDCGVTQSQTAANIGTIEDNSRNEFRHETVRAIIRNLPA